MKFLFTRMHHSKNHDGIKYHSFKLEDIRSRTGDKWSGWDTRVFIDDYNSDYGYQDESHIDSKSFWRFSDLHKLEIAGAPMALDPGFGLSDIMGSYFSRNKPTEFSKSAHHFFIQDKLNHHLGIDFSRISQYAAENGIDVCDLDPSEFFEMHRCYISNMKTGDYIRQATRADLKPIAELFTGDPEFGFMSNHIINNFINNIDCISLVCCDSSTKVVGAHLAKIMSDNTIHDSYNKLQEDKRGLGIGRMLFDMLVICAEKMGSNYIYTDCLSDSKSINFYEHLGLVRGETIENSQKQKLVRLYYHLNTDQESLF